MCFCFYAAGQFGSGFELKHTDREQIMGDFLFTNSSNKMLPWVFYSPFTNMLFLQPEVSGR